MGGLRLPGLAARVERARRPPAAAAAAADHPPPPAAAAAAAARFYIRKLPIVRPMAALC